MKLAAWIVGVAIAAAAGCACKGSRTVGTGTGTGTGPGTGTGTGTGVVDATACDGQLAHVTALYQAAAERTAERQELTEVEIADNVAMVMKECRAAPAKVVPCVALSTAVAQLERQCLPALDDDGREGQVFLDR
jgi:hypothetical protein